MLFLIMAWSATLIFIKQQHSYFFLVLLIKSKLTFYVFKEISKDVPKSILILMLDVHACPNWYD